MAGCSTSPAPFLAAAFARSAGPRSRLATWLAVDPARTAFDDRLLHGDDPVAAYADFAAGATPFVDDGRGDHLTTLFPPVRPRGRYLEVRFLDVQDGDAIGTLVEGLAALLYDDDARAGRAAPAGRGGPRLASTGDAAHGAGDVAARGREPRGADRATDGGGGMTASCSSPTRSPACTPRSTRASA